MAPIQEQSPTTSTSWSLCLLQLFDLLAIVSCMIGIVGIIQVFLQFRALRAAVRQRRAERELWETFGSPETELMGCTEEDCRCCYPFAEQEKAALTERSVVLGGTKAQGFMRLT